MTFRIGLLGAGIVGASHVRAAVGAQGYQIAAVCDVRRESAEALAPGLPVFTDYQDMLAAADLDAVIVTTPHAMHVEHVMSAAKAGLHVLVEKPMATTVDDCTRMMRACADNDRLLAVAHVIHFDPVAREARRIIQSGQYGSAPLLITHRRSAHYERDSRPAWFFDRDLAGGGIVLNVGTHGLDRIQWFGGSVIDRVSSVVRGRPGMAVETDSLVLMDLANGVSASITLTSRGMPYVDETEVAMEEVTLRVSGTDGLSLLRGGEVTQLLAPDSDYGRQAFRAQLDGFVLAAQGLEGEYVDGSYGRSVVAAALAVYKAAEHGHAVTP